MLYIYNNMVKISRRIRAIRGSFIGRRSRVGGRPGSAVDCRKSDDCNQAKFIEIVNNDIIKGVSDGTLNMNPNYKDKNYFRLINQYNAAVNKAIRFFPEHSIKDLKVLKNLGDAKKG